MLFAGTIEDPGFTIYTVCNFLNLKKKKKPF